ncbi:MAG: FAD-binding protein, partial [Bacteroidota bacterium]
ISEAVRGEGAYLLNSDGQRFMSNYHEMEELAPRDVVAKAIFTEISKSNKNYIYLDARHLGFNLIKDKFTNIYNFALIEGIDITEELIPIAPAAHYSIGGIKTDTYGSTNIKRLFAIGEAASTGVHGANRLASNSLLECLVFGRRAIAKANENLSEELFIPENGSRKYIISDSSLEHYNSTRQIVQNLFTENVGIIREESGLQNALEKIDEMKNKLLDMSNDIYSMRERRLLMLAESIVKSALYRHESRGSHQRRNYPYNANEFLGHVVIKNSEIKFEKINE